MADSGRADEVRLRVTGDAGPFVQAVKDGVTQAEEVLGGAPHEIPVSTEEAQAAVAALDAKIKVVAADVEDFASRTVTSSDNFGSGIVRAAQDAKLGLDSLLESVAEMRANGDPVSPEAIAKLEALAAVYEITVVAAGEVVAAQQEVSASIKESAAAAAEAGQVAATALETAYAEAAAAVENFAAKAESRTGERAMNNATLAIRRYQAALEEARASGGLVTPEQEGALDVFGAGVQSSTAKLAGYKTQLIETKEVLKQAQFEAGNFKGALGGMDGILSAISPALGSLSIQLFALYGSFLLAKQGFEVLDKFAAEEAVAFVEADRGVTDAQLRQAAAAELVAKANAEALNSTEQLGFATDEMNVASASATDSIEAQLAALQRLDAAAKAKKNLSSEEAAFIEDNAKLEIAAIDQRLETATFANDAERQQMVAAREEMVRLVAAYSSAGLAARKKADDTKALREEIDKLITSTIGSREEAARQSTAFLDSIQRLGGISNLTKEASESLVSAGEKIEGEYRRLGLAVPEALRAAVDALKKQADDFAAVLKRLGVASQETVEASARDLQQYAAAVESSGKVTRAEADLIVASVKKIEAEFLKLPASQRVGSDATIAELKKLGAAYESFTSEYAKKQEEQARAAAKTTAEEKKQFEERERNLLKFLQDLDTIAKKDAGGGKERESVQKNLDAAKQELSGLAAKPFLSPDDENRAEALHKEISQLQKDLTNLGPAATSSGSGFQRMALVSAAALKDIRDKIEDTIGNSKAFAETWSKLTPQVQGDLKALVTNFVELISTGKATTGQVADFAEAFARLAGTAGAAGDQMVSKFRAMTDSSQQVKVAFDGLDKGAQTAASGLKTATDASGPAADGMKQVAAAAGQARNAAAGTGGGYIKLHDATKQLTNAQGELLPNFVAVVNAADKATAGTLSYGGVTADVGKQSETAAGGIMKVGDQVIRIGGAVKDAQPHIEKTATDTKDLGTNAEKTATSVKDAGTAAKDASAPISQLGEAEKKAGADAHQGAAGIAESGKAAADSVAPTAALVAQLAKLPDLKLPAYWHDIAQGLTDSVKGFQDANVAVGILVATISGDLPKLKDFVAVLKDVRAEARGLTTDIAAQNVVMREAVQLCNALTACQKEAAKA